ncbi:hypothetical protein [Actinomadura sp. CNU-125]|uniref:hypothetical protein n=1 Tax=Actinomadura sp. CNU-125 TaxID=1904961 RepID=UPI000AEF12DB|nr:hypothetical protein [Actinomadura sp. CNU-125]
MTGPLVVIGDVLLDVDIVGSTGRLCPDAPVPVVERAEERPRPGGAGMAALLAAAEGRDVVLVTALADDDPGRRLRAMLERHVDVAAFHLHGGTPCKLRIRSGGQSVARLDAGEGEAMDGPVGPRVAAAVSGAGAVLVSDYGRGVTRHRAVRSLLADLPPGVPVVWDPHPRGEPPVPDVVRLLTPNEEEAARLAAADGADISGFGLSAAGRRGRRLGRSWGIDGVAVTLVRGGGAAVRRVGGAAVPGARRTGPRRLLRGGRLFRRRGRPGAGGRRAAPRGRHRGGPAGLGVRPGGAAAGVAAQLAEQAPRGWCPSAARTPGTSPGGRGARAGRWWRPAAASTFCTRGTSACCSRRGGSATA